MKRKHLAAFAGASLLAAAFVSTLRAADQPAGSISGRVQNVATNAYLEGAIVTLEPGTTSSGEDGASPTSALRSICSS